MKKNVVFMESYEYNKVIEKKTEHIQFLTNELASASYDLSGYMNESGRQRTIFTIWVKIIRIIHILRGINGEDPL